MHICNSSRQITDVFLARRPLVSLVAAYHLLLSSKQAARGFEGFLRADTWAVDLYWLTPKQRPILVLSHIRLGC